MLPRLQIRILPQVARISQLVLATALVFAAQPILAQEPPPQPAPQTPARVAPIRASYTCDNNVSLVVTYRGPSARVSYKGHIYLMKQVLSADGGRYSDGTLVWWSKGRGGFLAKADDTSPAGGEQLASNCHQVDSKPPTQ